MCLVGYGLGLLIANMAVAYFSSGQPALFYIVPLTLGPVLIRSVYDESFKELWEKLPPLRPIATPLDSSEEEELLRGGNSSVIRAVATWDFYSPIVETAEVMPVETAQATRRTYAEL